MTTVREVRLNVEVRIKERIAHVYSQDASYPRERMRFEDEVAKDIALLDAYRAAIETRVRAEVDAEWRARVEGMRRKIPSITPILERVTARIAGWNDALDALLTAVARDREG